MTIDVIDAMNNIHNVPVPKAEMEQYKIRKLTPTECYRLMGWKDESIDRVKNIGMSNSQMYAQAGNGIVTNCVELIFEHLYKAQYDPDFECFDEMLLRTNTNVIPLYD